MVLYGNTRARPRTHTRTHARTHTQKVMFVMLLNWFVSLNFELLWRSWDRIYILKNCTLDRVLLRCECFQVMMTSWFERLFLVFIFVFAVVFCHNETCTFEFALNIQVVNYASVECHHSATVHSYAHFLFLHCTVCLVLNSLSGPEQSVLSGSEQYILSGQFGSEQYVLSWTVWFWTVCLVLGSLVLNSMSCPGQSGSEHYVLSWTVWFWTVCFVLDSLVLNRMSCPGQSASEQYVLSWTVWFWTVCLVLDSLLLNNMSCRGQFSSEQYSCPGRFGFQQYVLSWTVWFSTVCLVLDSLVFNSMSCSGQSVSEQYILSWTVCLWTECHVWSRTVLVLLDTGCWQPVWQYIVGHKFTPVERAGFEWHEKRQSV